MPAKQAKQGKTRPRDKKRTTRMIAVKAKMRTIIYHHRHLIELHSPTKAPSHSSIMDLRRHIKNEEQSTHHKVVRQGPQFVVTKDRDDHQQITEDGHQDDGDDRDD